MTDEAKTLGTNELAAKLKMKPKALRALLRDMGKGAKGEHYEWKERDLPKLVAAIKEHKKAAKKETK